MILPERWFCKDAGLRGRIRSPWRKGKPQRSCKVRVEQVERKWPRWTDVVIETALLCQEEEGRGSWPLQAPKLGLCENLYYLCAKSAHPWTLDKRFEAKTESQSFSPNIYLVEALASLTNIYSMFKRHVASKP